jgi:hypothetical protein
VVSDLVEVRSDLAQLGADLRHLGWGAGLLRACQCGILEGARQLSDSG